MRPRARWSGNLQSIRGRIAVMATAADIQDQAISSAKKGLAPSIRKMAVAYPELSNSEIARTVGCSPQNVSCVLETFLAGTSPETLRDFQENKADVYDAIQYKLLASLTQEKIDKSKPMEAITGAAILEDKARLVRGLATGINVSVLRDVVDAIRSKPPQVIDSRLQRVIPGDVKPAGSAS
jgi:hypothetical protein